MRSPTTSGEQTQSSLIWPKRGNFASARATRGNVSRVASVATVMAKMSNEERERCLIAIRYHGEEAGNAFADQTHGPSTFIIRMRPRRWLSFDYSTE